jgi:hypothetical protein
MAVFPKTENEKAWMPPNQARFFVETIRTNHPVRTEHRTRTKYFAKNKRRGGSRSLAKRQYRRQHKLR